MKFIITASILVVGLLTSLVVTDNVSDIGDYFYGLDATDVAPYSCTSASEYFSCYRPVSAYENCGNLDDSDSCNCSSALIDEECHTKYCPNLTYDTYDITRYCKASATPVSSPAKTTSAPSITTTGKSSSSSSSFGAAAGAASASSSAKPAALATDSSAQATSTPSSSSSSSSSTTTTAAAAGSSSSNAGGRSVLVSVGGVVVAVAAVAVAAAFA